MFVDMRIEDFEKFLKSKGFSILQVSNNQYEVLRAQKKSKAEGSRVVVVYRKGNGSLSLMEKDMDLYKEFKNKGNSMDDMYRRQAVDMEASRILMELDSSYRAVEDIRIISEIKDLDVAKEIIKRLYYNKR